MLRWMYGASSEFWAGVTFSACSSGRVDDADDQRHEGPDADGEDGQRPALAPDVEDEQDGRGEDRHAG